MILGLGHYGTANAVTARPADLGANLCGFNLWLGVRRGRSLADATAKSGVEVDVLVLDILDRSLCRASRLVDLSESLIALLAEEVRLGLDRLNLGILLREGLVGDHLRALVGRVRNLRGEEANGAESVVVAGDHIINYGRVAVGVDNRDNRDAQLACLGNRDGLVVGVDHEESHPEGASCS